MNKTATSLGLAAALGLATLAGVLSPVAAPSASAQTTPPTSSQIISTPESGKDTLVASSKSGKRRGSFNVYKTAGKSAKIQIVLKSPNKSRILFTVISESDDSYYVNLPSRPNGSKGYIKKADVTTYKNPFKITISLTEKRISVYKSDILLKSANVGIGIDSTPTPTGEFYTYWIRRPKAGSRGYGDYIIGISGFSNVYKSFGTGDGRVGLHGTYNNADIGKPVSAGCVRMSNEMITYLKNTIYMGTPVIIYK